MNVLERVVRLAWKRGQSFDLTGVGFGRILWDDKVSIETRPPSYYYFLSGITALLQARTCLEIGTHWGGSGIAILKGMKSHDPSSELITVDVTTESDNFLPTTEYTSSITKIVGDANSFDVIKKIEMMKDRVDFLYIDSDHGFESTLMSFFVYKALLNPHFVVFDDINLSLEMRNFWEIMRRTFAKTTINCFDVEPNIRHVESGFGLWISNEFLSSLGRQYLREEQAADAS
jgi:hypothetical protein